MALAQLKSYGIKLYSPTYKRAGSLDTIDIFGDDLILACHQFEEADYREKHPNNELLILPDDTQKNMAKVRNYILDHSDADYIVMIDDDIRKLQVIEEGERYSLKDIEHFLINGFEMSKEINTGLWGLNITDDPKAYRVYTPFSLLSPILGTFSAIIKSSLRYDERLSLNEDYDYFIQNIYTYRKTLRFNKYSYIANHLDKKGGCGSYRLMSEEMKQAQIMQRKWGKQIAKYDLSKSTNPRVSL